MGRLIVVRGARDGSRSPFGWHRLAVVGATSMVTAVLGLAVVFVAAAAAAGPPYPPPVTGQRVYDTAGALDQVSKDLAAKTIADIETRTGAQIVVYTQVKPESDTPEKAAKDAADLMDQWGIGRKGFDDGLVILYDLQANLVHGQVQLFAGSGFRAQFLSDSERQSIYQEDMLPYLERGDLGTATIVALNAVNGAATPEHAAALERGRQLNGLLGLAGLIVALAIVAFFIHRWVRFGRDPVYLDDPSILMPAPPPDLSPAAGALLLEGRSGPRELTAALVDLAARGMVAFRPEKHLLSTSAGIEVPADPHDTPAAERARRRPLDKAGAFLHHALRSSASSYEGAYMDPGELKVLASKIPQFHETLENDAVGRGWFTAPPGKVVSRWRLGSGVAAALGGLALFGGLQLPSDGLVVGGAAILVAAAIVFVGASAMPARTMSGAMLRAMLAAYGRTLAKTMQQARSMTDVVAARAVPWLETPDEAVAWGVAFGLQKEVDAVLARTVEDMRSAQVAPGSAWVPAWYGASLAATGSGGSGGGGWGGLAPGVLAASAVPDFGGMVAAIGSIGSSATASSGGGGGFGGGVSVGGGGAGGGF